MDIIIDNEVCIGCGICADMCPDVFKLDGQLAVVKAAPFKTDDPCCRNAADSCPVDAIEIKESPRSP